MFDVSQLTLGEVAAIEDLSGRSITALESDEAPQGKLMAALVYVIKRRTGSPRYTFNEALGLSLPEAAEIIGLDLDDDEAAKSTQDGQDGQDETTPTQAARKPAGKGKASSRGK